jgi:hypothetical protein
MNRKRFEKLILLIAFVFLLFSPSFTFARPEYAVKESRNCPFCHTRDGPPQLNEIGVYYVAHNHSVEGYVPTPKATPTPEPTKEIEIGVHMTTWDVGLQAMAMILLILAIIFVMRL